MTNEVNDNLNNSEVTMSSENTNVETQYVDEFGNPIDPSLIDEFGNYIGQPTTQYVDEFGNPIDPSLIDANGNYIGEVQYVDEFGNPLPSSVQNNTIDHNELANALNQAGEIEVLEENNAVVGAETQPITSAGAHQMDDKELITGMVTFDYNNVPITDIVNSIILDSINKGASDIHFDPFDDGIKIRLRVDGQLNDYSIVPLYVKKNMITRIKIISGMNITESRVPQDGAIRTELQNKTIDLRVSCLPTNMGEKIVIRIMDYSMSAQGIDALDFSEENLKKIKKMLELPNGIILVTGATGSGKSTTVYSMLQKLNVEGTNLVTVEDPIEMNIGGINQVQAVSEIGLTFATVLRSILRQDPDVIMIGEIRDDETARIAVRASITGHLVLSTIHTNNSLSTIERLTDMSVERYLLGSSLSGVVSQKLSRRLCEKCKRRRPTTDYEKEIFKQALNKDVEEIYEAVGCPECSRGYRGRIAIHEVLLLNQAIKDAITKGADKADLRKLVYSNHGTDTMLQDGLAKALEGKTSFEEVLKLVDLEDDLGSGTQLGLDDQIADSGYNIANENSNNTNQTNNQPPINITISPDMFQNANLNMPPINFTPNMAQPMYVPYPVNMEGIDPTNMEMPKEMPQINYGAMPQPMYIPYPVQTEDDIDDEQEIVIKPSKKKRKKKTVVEIDPDELFEDEVVTKIKKVKKRKVEIEEIDEEDNDSEPIESKVEIVEELDNKKIETIEELVEDNETEEDNQTTASQKEINKYKELTDEMNNLLEKLHSTKKIINKKKFNIKVQEILKEIEPLYKEIKTLDDDYKFNEKTEKEVKDLLNGIILNFQMLNNDKEINLYKRTKNKINQVLGIMEETITPNEETEIEELEVLEDTTEEIDNTDKIFDEVIKMMDEEFPEDIEIDLSILDNNLESIEVLEEDNKSEEPTTTLYEDDDAVEINLDNTTYEKLEILDIEDAISEYNEIEENIIDTLEEDIDLLPISNNELTLEVQDDIQELDVSDIRINENTIDDVVIDELLHELDDNN